MFGKKEENGRFRVIFKEGSIIGVTTKILLDTQTGVNYLFANLGEAGGLTLLVDKDGKPVITPPEDIKP